MTAEDKAAQAPVDDEERDSDGIAGDKSSQDTGTGKEATAEDLQRALNEAEQKAAEYYDQLLRVRADFENLRRRTERELAGAHKYAIEKFALELLPVRDSLKLGLAAIDDSAGDVAKIKEGMELTLKLLTDAMAKFGISEVNPDGDKFNPELHQAMFTQEAHDVEPNTVLAVHQHGYLLHDRLIRPAMVVVSSPKKPQKNQDSEVSQTTEQPGETS